MQMFFLLSAFKHAQNVKINILNGVGKGGFSYHHLCYLHCWWLIQIVQDTCNIIMIIIKTYYSISSFKGKRGGGLDKKASQKTISRN